MSKLNFVIMFSFLTLSVKAQVSQVIDIPYEVGDPYEVVDAQDKYNLKITNKFYFADDTKMISLKWTGKEAIIQTFDTESMRELTKKTFSDFPNKSQLENVVEHGSGYVFFFSTNTDSEGSDLYMRPFDMSGGFTQPSKLIIKAKDKVLRPFFGGWIDNSYRFSPLNKEKFFIAQDFYKSKLVITFQYKAEKEELNLLIIDEDLSVKVDLRTIELPYSFKETDQLEYVINDEAGFYILTREYFDKKRKYITPEGDPNFEMVVHYLDPEDNSFVKNVIDVDGMMITNASLIPDDKGNLLCAGFYSHAKMRKRSHVQDGVRINQPSSGILIQPKSINDVDAVGVFSFKLGKAGTLSNLVFVDFPLEVINLYVRKNEASRNENRAEAEKLGIPHLKLREVSSTTDGGTIIISEQFHVEMSTMNTGAVGVGGTGTTRTTYRYIYEDVYVSKFNKEGELQYMNKIPKQQETVLNVLYPYYRGGLSIKYHQTKEYHYVFFMDNVKNLGLDSQKKPAKHSDGAGGFFTGYRINNETGEMVQFSLFDMRDINKGKGEKIPGYQFTVDRMVKTKNSELLVELYVKKKKDRLIKIKLED